MSAGRGTGKRRARGRARVLTHIAAKQLLQRSHHAHKRLPTNAHDRHIAHLVSSEFECELFCLAFFCSHATAVDHRSLQSATFKRKIQVGKPGATHIRFVALVCGVVWWAVSDAVCQWNTPNIHTLREHEGMPQPLQRQSPATHRRHGGVASLVL